MKKIALILGIAILLIILAGCSSTPFRLHIIANSNSEMDQWVKLEVRDKVLELTGEDMNNCKDYLQAEVYMKEHLEEIIACANKVLAEHGFEYDAKAYIGEFEFPDKKYGDIVYPAGTYHAMRIVLGEGAGENWWCVMFPPLCLVNTEAEDAEQQGEIEYSSAVVDWFREVFGW